MAELTHISVVLNKVIEELIGLRDSINASETNTPTNEVKEPIKFISLEDVRKVLAELSRDGFTIEVRKLLQKYGANKLSEVDSSKYDSLIKEAGEMRNGTK